MERGTSRPDRGHATAPHPGPGLRSGRTTRKALVVPSLVKASESHLADCRYRHLSPQTLRLYGIYERAFLEWCQHEHVPLELTSLVMPHVKRASEWVRSRNGGKRGGEWAARTFVRTMKVWSRFLVEEEELEADYLSRLHAPKVTQVARQAYQTWEIQAIRGALSETTTGVRDVAILSLLLDTGLRVGELVQLRVGDLDLRSRRVMVASGKGRKQRVLPFGGEARDGGNTVRRLRAYLETRGRLHQDDPIFITVEGRPLSDSAFRRAFIKAARRAGVSHHEVHGTRHTFSVRYLVAHPNDVEGLRYLLGHISDDTYRIYAGQAGAIIAEIAGRESIADAMFGEEPTMLRALPSRSLTLNDGPGPRLQAKNPSAAASQRPAGRRPLSP